MPKHDGHATSARREPQCEHEVASGATGAPQEGQFRVSGVAGMAWVYYIGERVFASVVLRILGTSNIEHPTSNIEHRTSNIEHWRARTLAPPTLIVNRLAFMIRQLRGRGVSRRPVWIFPDRDRVTKLVRGIGHNPLSGLMIFPMPYPG